MAVGLELDVPFPTIARALGRFRGVDRRFQLKGKANGAIVVDRAAVPTFYFQRLETTRKPLLQGWELGSIHLEDFEVIAFNANDRLPFPSEEEQVGGSGLDEDLDVNILSGEQ